LFVFTALGHSCRQVGFFACTPRMLFCCFSVIVRGISVFVAFLAGPCRPLNSWRNVPFDAKLRRFPSRTLLGVCGVVGQFGLTAGLETKCGKVIFLRLRYGNNIPHTALGQSCQKKSSLVCAGGVRAAGYRWAQLGKAAEAKRKLHNVPRKAKNQRGPKPRAAQCLKPGPQNRQSLLAIAFLSRG